jgi:diguanylate cyclase (GGDEF)-like protein
MSSPAAEAFVAIWRAQLERQSAGGFTEALGEKIYEFRFEPRPHGGHVVVVEDVTDARRAALEIERMAHFDSVTGLPNRVQFHQQLGAALRDRRGRGRGLALLSIDLDHFKDVNDTRGHPAGDELLRLVASRLCESVRPGDIVARFGGDEFQVLLRGVCDPADVLETAERLICAISENYLLADSTVAIGASIGIALIPDSSVEPDDLIRWADMALYRAKADGRGLARIFSPEMDVAVRHKRELESMLREAIARQYLELQYQPVVDVRSGAVVACEALVRLRHPTRGMISPAEFIPAAEETGLILEIGDWVLSRACADAASWPGQVRVAVNFSPKQFILRPDMASHIRAALEASGLDPKRLEVEITESTLMEAKDAIGELERISAMGVKIALDDFGTGYSSLSYLRQFPVDKIKIDRSFAQDVLSRASKAVIGSVSVLAQMLEVELVVEGVETPAQLNALKHWDVKLVQGYLFSRPLPLEQLLPHLKRAAPFRSALALRRAA